jgi:hypothetical protein
MANQFKIQEAITFTQQTPPETFRLMDITIQVTPVAYEHGMVIATAETTDILVADEVNIFTMNCATGVSLKVGSTTNPSMSNVTFFSYQGSKTSFYVSNAGTEDITISFATSAVA